MGRAFALLARWFGVFLYHIGLAPLVIRLARRKPKVLLYHACEPEESDFTRGLQSNTTPSQFERHLSFLRRRYNIVPLSSLENGTVPHRAVIITFDDGYRSVYDHALPLLAEQAAPATVYLIGDVVGNESLVWVNELNWFLNSRPTTSLPVARARLGAASADAAPDIIERARANFDATIINALLEDLRAAAGDGGPDLARRARVYLDWSQVEQMTRSQVSFGNHTASHPSLSRLTPAEQAAELERCRDIVAKHLGACTSVAYPFGDHDDAARRAALSLGHRSIMEVGGVNAPLALDHVARVPVFARSDAELFAEMEIVTPVKAALKRLLR